MKARFYVIKAKLGWVVRNRGNIDQVLPCETRSKARALAHELNRGKNDPPTQEATHDEHRSQ